MRTLFIFLDSKIYWNYEISRQNWKFCEKLTQKNFFEKIDFFWSSAHKWAFCQKITFFTQYPAKRSKKRVKKLESKGSTLWFFSKNGHFWKLPSITNPKKVKNWPKSKIDIFQIDSNFEIHKIEISGQSLGLNENFGHFFRLQNLLKLRD